MKTNWLGFSRGEAKRKATSGTAETPAAAREATTPIAPKRGRGDRMPSSAPTMPPSGPFSQRWAGQRASGTNCATIAPAVIPASHQGAKRRNCPQKTGISRAERARNVSQNIRAEDSIAETSSV